MKSQINRRIFFRSFAATAALRHRECFLHLECVLITKSNQFGLWHVHKRLNYFFVKLCQIRNTAACTRSFSVAPTTAIDYKMLISDFVSFQTKSIEWNLFYFVVVVVKGNNCILNGFAGFHFNSWCGWFLKLFVAIAEAINIFSIGNLSE